MRIYKYICKGYSFVRVSGLDLNTKNGWIYSRFDLSLRLTKL